MLKDLLNRANACYERATTKNDVMGHDIGFLKTRGLIHDLSFGTEDHQYMIIIDHEGLYIGDGERNSIHSKDSSEKFMYKWSSESGRFPSYKDYAELDKKLETVHSPKSIAKFLARYKITKNDLQINGGKFTGDAADVEFMQSIWDAIQ